MTFLSQVKLDDMAIILAKIRASLKEEWPYVS